MAGFMVLSACSSTGPGGSAGAAGSTPAPHTGSLNIVAGENFWGSIAAQLAGKAGTVTSIVSDPNGDPHSYETSSDDARAFATADYVVLNGAGYDTWANRLLTGNPRAHRKVLSVADLLGKKDGDNPHFWYSPDYVTKVADQIESDLKSIDPADSAYFDAQRAAFDAAGAGYRGRLVDIKAKFAGAPVASTESIFVYLAQYLGLDLISPPEFMQAVSEGNDPPAPAVAQFQDQITKKQVRALVYNRQTSTAVTTNLTKLADQLGIATTAVTETIQPADATYQSWFDGELQSLDNAFAASTSPLTAP